MRGGLTGLPDAPMIGKSTKEALHARMEDRDSRGYALGVLIGTAAYAAIPDSSGVISACYAKSNGGVRIIDAEAGATCVSNKEQALSWSQRGPAGPPGPPGAIPDVFVAKRNSNQLIVPGDGSILQIVTLDLAPGRYLVSGKVHLSNRAPQLGLRVTCWLIPSNPDGTPGDPGAPESDFGQLELARAGDPGDEGQTTHFVTEELTQPGMVELSCLAIGNDSGAFTAYAWISAIEVGSITTESEQQPPLP
jgi:hypothetical protein